MTNHHSDYIHKLEQQNEELLNRLSLMEQNYADFTGNDYLYNMLELIIKKHKEKIKIPHRSDATNSLIYFNLGRQAGHTTAAIKYIEKHKESCIILKKNFNKTNKIPKIQSILLDELVLWSNTYNGRHDTKKFTTFMVEFFMLDSNERSSLLRFINNNIFVASALPSTVVLI